MAGFCVPPMHKESLANAMITLCKNKMTREEMGKAGKQRVQRYYLHEISMNKYMKLYQEVL